MRSRIGLIPIPGNRRDRVKHLRLRVPRRLREHRAFAPALHQAFWLAPEIDLAGNTVDDLNDATRCMGKLLIGLMERQTAKDENYGSRLRALRAKLTEAETRLGRLYTAIENGSAAPAGVPKALTYMSDTLKRGKGTEGKIDLYLIGAGMLGDTMGEAAAQKGFESGRRWSDPGDGEQRIDMTPEAWRRIRYLANIGFLNQMPNYKRMLEFPFRTEEDAKLSEAAIKKLEHATNHRESDPEYSDALQRDMLIWAQWPSK